MQNKENINFNIPIELSLTLSNLLKNLENKTNIEIPEVLLRGCGNPTNIIRPALAKDRDALENKSDYLFDIPFNLNNDIYEYNSKNKRKFTSIENEQLLLNENKIEDQNEIIEETEGEAHKRSNCTLAILTKKLVEILKNSNNTNKTFQMIELADKLNVPNDKIIQICSVLKSVNLISVDNNSIIWKGFYQNIHDQHGHDSFNSTASDTRKINQTLRCKLDYYSKANARSINQLKKIDEHCKQIQGKLNSLLAEEMINVKFTYPQIRFAIPMSNEKSYLLINTLEGLNSADIVEDNSTNSLRLQNKDPIEVINITSHYD